MEGKKHNSVEEFEQNCFEIFDRILEDIWGKNTSASAIFEKLYTEFRNKETYFQDIDISIYMKYTKKKSGKMDSVKAGKLKELYDKISKYEISETRLSEKKGSKGRYEKSILTYYPFDDMNDLSVWCEDYQCVLFSDENVEVFSIEKETNDLTRYGYDKTKRICRKLHESKAENLIMAEMTLGIMLTNVIFNNLDIVNKAKEISEYDGILQRICKIPGINMRIKVAQCIFGDLKENLQRNEILDIIQTLDWGLPKIEETFLKFLKAHIWYLNSKETSKNDILAIKKDIEEQWKYEALIDPGTDYTFAKDKGLEKLLHLVGKANLHKEGIINDISFYLPLKLFEINNAYDEDVNRIIDGYNPEEQIEIDEYIIKLYEDEEKRRSKDIKKAEKLTNSSKYALLHAKIVRYLLTEYKMFKEKKFV